jgi:hypothetical protein
MQSYFVISAYIPNEKTDLGEQIVLWSDSSEWVENPVDATRYATLKQAEDALSIAECKNLNLTTKAKVSECCVALESSSDDDDDGDDLEFDEDGECGGDDTWDYPCSPCLSDDDDIY